MLQLVPTQLLRAHCWGGGSELEQGSVSLARATKRGAPWSDRMPVFLWPRCAQMLASVRRVQSVLRELPADPSMSAALPPGAWWEVANRAGSDDVEAGARLQARSGGNGTRPAKEGSSSRLGRAVMAARHGDLELR